MFVIHNKPPDQTMEEGGDGDYAGLYQTLDTALVPDKSPGHRPFLLRQGSEDRQLQETLLTMAWHWVCILVLEMNVKVPLSSSNHIL